MLGVELTTGQKVQIAFIVVILAISGVFVFKATRRDFDTAINCYVFPRHVALDPNKPITPANGKNPPDPKKEQMVTEFVCADGKLDIIQFLNDAARAPVLTFTPETRIPNLVYQYYHDPMAPVAKITDPFQHALAYAAYRYVYGATLGLPKVSLLGQLGFNSEQLQKEASARTRMDDAIKVIDIQVQNGSYHRELMDKIMAALAAYMARAGDPMHDSAKADLARQVLLAASTYLNRVEQDKSALITTYMDAMAKVITPDQQQKLITLVQQQTSKGRSSTVSRRGSTGTPPARSSTPAARPGTPGRAGAVPPPRAPRGSTN